MPARYLSLIRVSLPWYRSQAATNSTPGTFKAVSRSILPIIPAPINATRIRSFALIRGGIGRTSSLTLSFALRILNDPAPKANVVVLNCWINFRLDDEDMAIFNDKILSYEKNLPFL